MGQSFPCPLLLGHHQRSQPRMAMQWVSWCLFPSAKPLGSARDLLQRMENSSPSHSPSLFYLLIGWWQNKSPNIIWPYSENTWGTWQVTVFSCADRNRTIVWSLCLHLKPSLLPHHGPSGLRLRGISVTQDNFRYLMDSRKQLQCMG